VGLRRSIALLLISAAIAFAQVSRSYAIASDYVRQNRLDIAIPMLEKILSDTPNDLMCRNLLGIALLNSGRKEEAVEQFRKALQADPDFRAALKNLAVAEMALGSRNDAKAHFERLLKLTPADPVAHLYMGEINFAENHPQQAIDHYNQSGDLHWKDPQVTIHFAKSALQLNQPKLAEDALEHLGLDVPNFRFEAGVMLAAAKRYSAAAMHFAAAQNGYPDPYEVGFNLTLMHVEAQNYPAAIFSGEKLAEKYRKAELYNLLSRAYEGGGTTQQAYDALRTATQIDPNDETNYLDLMSLCLAHENWDLSLEISDIALTHAPNSYRVHLERGAVLAMKGRTEDAEKEFVAATRLDPKTSLPLVALAIIQIELKKPEEAAVALRARRKQNPKDYLVDWFLAEALVQVGADPGTPNEKEAVAALEDAVSANSTAVSPRVLLGKLLAKRGNTARATAQFEAALKLDPGNVTAAYQLATLYRKAGNTRRATELMTLVGKATSASDASLSPRRELVRIVREGAK